MTSKTTPGSLKGYDHQFVDHPPDDLLCLKCGLVARDPQQITCCNKVICKVCLRDFSNCPQCKRPIVNAPCNRSTRLQRIQSLKTRCDNTSNGCQWIGELRSLDKHLLSCDFTLLSCPNQCQEGEEILKLLRKDIDKHKKEECPRRQYECPHCKETGEYKERTTTHLETCPNAKIPCPNDGCGEHIQRNMIQQHYQKCSFELVSCKYSNIGCMVKVLRKDLKFHEGDNQLHLGLAIDTVHKQQGKIKELEDTLAQLKPPLAKAPTGYRFKVTDFNHHKESDDVIYSPAFYTSHGGYKMCICVDANGNGDGRGTHVSVLAFMMHGENDDHLPWPFTGTVTVELLNQLEDDNHYSSVTTFPRDDGASRRVTDGERAPNGLGRQRYIPHSSIDYDRATHCQYLKDDCLYFRVTVDAKTTSKPWLI